MTSINNNNYNTTIKHFSTEEIIILVGVPIIASNESHDIDRFYQEKDYILNFKSTHLSPQNMFFGHETYWSLSLTFASLVLTIPHGGTILAPL